MMRRIQIQVTYHTPNRCSGNAMLSIPSIRKGAITSDVARWAVNWLDDRWER